MNKYIFLIVFIFLNIFTPVVPAQDYSHASTVRHTQFSALKAWYEGGQTDSPVELLKQDPIIQSYFAAPAGVTEGYTIEQHTKRVLDRFQSFKRETRLPAPLTETDFLLFLSLHDIGKNKAKQQAAGGIENTPLNQKAYELKYCQEIFEQVAKAIGMDDHKVKILSGLLQSDTIGEYLKGWHSECATYNLLVRDAAKCGMPTHDFFDLHVLFHKLDAGSYPTLQFLFEGESMEYGSNLKEKIGKLEDIFITVERIRAEVVQGKDDFLQAIFKPGKNGFTESNIKASADLNLYTYTLRLQLHYGLADTKQEAARFWTLIEKLKDRINKDYWDESFDISPSVYELNELFLAMNHPRVLCAVHGSNSGVLVGLMQTATTLYPSGTLNKIGIVPLSGELGRGSLGTGINANCLSAYPAEEYNRSLNWYAKKYHVAPTVLIEKINRYLGLNHACIKIHEGEKDRKDAAGDSMYMAAINRFFASNIENISEIPYAVKQLRVLGGNEELLLQLETRVESDAALLAEYAQSDLYKKQLPKQLGGMHHDYYYINKYKTFKEAMDDSLKAFTQEIRGVAASSALLQNPFPILFATSLPCQKTGRAVEVAFAGPLALGEGIPYIFVPDDKVLIMQEWINSNVIGSTKPQVLATTAIDEMIAGMKNIALPFETYFE